MAETTVTYVVDATSANRAFAEYGHNGKAALAELLDDLADWGRDYAAEVAPVDRGALSEMIYPQWADCDKFESQIISDMEYSATMEKGAQPFWPPTGALSTWGKFREVEMQKGGTSTSDFFLRKHIAEHGIRAHPYMKPTVTALGGALQQFMGHYIDSLKNGAKYSCGGRKSSEHVAARNKMQERYRKSMPSIRSQRKPSVRQKKRSEAKFLNPRTGKYESSRPKSIDYHKTPNRGVYYPKSKPYGSYYTTSRVSGKPVSKGGVKVAKAPPNRATKAQLRTGLYKAKRNRKI
jgi:hypothetical protein